MKEKEHKHMSEFVSAAPPSGGVDWSTLKGKLLVVEPLSFEAEVRTSIGDKSAVRANVYALTSATDAEEYPDTLIFPKVLVNQTRNQVGRKVVGRLGQGVAKPGQNAPWLLEEATADDLTKAEAWLKAQAAPALQSAEAPF